MNSVTISVYDLTGPRALDPEIGKKLQETITAHFKKNVNVILDFSQITHILTLFLNPAIGDLYGTFSSEEIKEKLKLANVSDTDFPVFAMVLDRAKSFYDHPKEWSEAIQEVLEDE